MNSSAMMMENSSSQRPEVPADCVLLDRTQTVVSEVTHDNQSLFRGPMYPSAREISSGFVSVPTTPTTMTEEYVTRLESKRLETDLKDNIGQRININDCEKAKDVEAEATYAHDIPPRGSCSDGSPSEPQGYTTLAQRMGIATTPTTLNDIPPTIPASRPSNPPSRVGAFPIEGPGIPADDEESPSPRPIDDTSSTTTPANPNPNLQPPPEEHLLEAELVEEGRVNTSRQDLVQNDDGDVMVVAEELTTTARSKAKRRRPSYALVLAILAIVALVITVAVVATKDKDKDKEHQDNVVSKELEDLIDSINTTTKGPSSNTNPPTPANNATTSSVFVPSTPAPTTTPVNASTIRQDIFAYCGTLSQQQSDYRGTINTTQSGLECQRWDQQTPHKHSRTSSQYPYAGLAENYCRNPDGEQYSWCYTTSPNQRWDFCSVPICSPQDVLLEELQPYLNNTLTSEEMNGTAALVDPPICIPNKELLQEAVRAYVTDPSNPNNSSTVVSKIFGWPMGSWCLNESIRTLGPIFQGSISPQVVLSNGSMVSNPAFGFVEDIGSWDVSNVLDFSKTFESFQNLSSQQWGFGRWNTSNAKRLVQTFARTTIAADNAATLDLSQWDLRSATTLTKMFKGSNLRSANISDWKVGNVNSVFRMFEGARDWNDDLANWDMSSVINMEGMFNAAESFNADISNWNVGSVSNANYVFRGSYSFNQPLKPWDVSNATTMWGTFKDAITFNQDLSMWDVSNVQGLRGMFMNATSFNQNLCRWGQLLPSDADVKNMFIHTSCPNQKDPVLSEGGPFCHDCS